MSATTNATAIGALRSAQAELATLFGLGAQAGTISSLWQRARQEWDDDVAKSVESGMYAPLLRDAQALHSGLGELVCALEHG
jgi:hypothetical protein